MMARTEEKDSFQLSILSLPMTKWGKRRAKNSPWKIFVLSIRISRNSSDVRDSPGWECIDINVSWLKETILMACMPLHAVEKATRPVEKRLPTYSCPYTDLLH